MPAKGNGVWPRLVALAKNTMAPAGEWSIGDCTALAIDPRNGVLSGAAGPRRNKSYAVAW